MKPTESLCCEISMRSMFWWILGTIFVPISVPYLFMKMLANIRERKSRSRLPGKVVVITGGSSGLGESLANIFYLSGCKVVICARRIDELERVKKDLINIETKIRTFTPIILQLDLADLNSIPGKVSEILEQVGKIDILINNAGISVRADAMATTLDVDIKVMLVNYFGTVAMTKAILPSMVNNKEGRVVCVSSIQGKFAIPHRSAYTASKHAVQAFCDSLRAEVNEHNVKVTVVSPGYINTSLSLNALTGSGKNYGVTDATTSQGDSSDQVAFNILREILRETDDVILAPLAPKAAYWLRFLCPTLYFIIMSKRAKKLNYQTKINN